MRVHPTRPSDGHKPTNQPQCNLRSHNLRVILKIKNIETQIHIRFLCKKDDIRFAKSDDVDISLNPTVENEPLPNQKSGVVIIIHRVPTHSLNYNKVVKTTLPIKQNIEFHKISNKKNVSEEKLEKMEAEKRKRSEEKSSSAKRKKEKEEMATDAEVEEFFAILRRMQEAVKYFGEGWRTTVETDTKEVPLVDDREVNKGATSEVEAEENNGVALLDLNTVPEGESHVASS